MQTRTNASQFRKLLPKTQDQWALAAVVLCGILILITVGMFGHSMASKSGVFGQYHLQNIWEVWELGAILWSAIFVAYYFIEYSMQKDGPRDKWILLLVIASGAVPVSAIIALIFLKNAFLHFGLEVCMSIIYCALDFVLAESHFDEEERLKYRESFLLADVPTVFANLILFTFVWTQSDQPGVHIFSSGAIAFQLLTCNCIFVVTQLGLIRQLSGGGRIHGMQTTDESKTDRELLSGSIPDVTSKSQNPKGSKKS